MTTLIFFILQRLYTSSTYSSHYTIDWFAFDSCQLFFSYQNSLQHCWLNFFFFTSETQREQKFSPVKMGNLKKKKRKIFIGIESER